MCNIFRTHIYSSTQGERHLFKVWVSSAQDYCRMTRVDNGYKFVYGLKHANVIVG